MIIDFINGAKTDKMFGYKRVQDELHRRLPKSIKIKKIEYTPSGNMLLQSVKLFFSYPLKVFFKTRKNDVKHLTSPDVAYLLNIFRFRKTLVSCYDLISYHRIDDFGGLRKFFIKQNYKGVLKAEHILTISDYSKQDIIKTLKYPAEKISIIYPCVDLEKYYPKRDKAILKKHGLNAAGEKSEKILLYVGSEEPRQNVDKIIKALDILSKKYPSLKLVKVGKPQWPGGREKLLTLIEKLGLTDKVIFTDYVPEEDLPKFYNAADVFVYPCSYAGWGLPPMEALACGTPVVVSDTTSLPEAVGDGGICINPHDHVALAYNIDLLLKDTALRKKKISAGLKHVKKFSWNTESKKLEKIYQNL
jgi:glycosyltransferase involved in cell wall biosynthesis